MEYNELASAIEEGIEKLPPKCKNIFLMSREGQMSYQEIADELGISLKTVKTQMYRAVKKIKNFLSDKNVNIILFFFF